MSLSALAFFVLFTLIRGAKPLAAISLTKEVPALFALPNPIALTGQLRDMKINYRQQIIEFKSSTRVFLLHNEERL